MDRATTDESQLTRQTSKTCRVFGHVNHGRSLTRTSTTVGSVQLGLARIECAHRCRYLGQLEELKERCREKRKLPGTAKARSYLAHLAEHSSDRNIEPSSRLEGSARDNGQASWTLGFHEAASINNCCRKTPSNYESRSWLLPDASIYYASAASCQTSSSPANIVGLYYAPKRLDVRARMS